MDLDFFFDIGPHESHCTLEDDEHNYLFENYDSRYNQFVVSDRVANCFLQAMQKQRMLDFVLTSQSLRENFGTSLVLINAQFLYSFYPQIADYYGTDEELEVEIKFDKPRFRFAPDNSNSDVHFQTTVKLGVKRLNSPNYVVYDEIQFETEFDFEISEEQVLANFATMKVSPAGDFREAPIFTDLDISPAAYEDFWDFARLKTEQWLDFFNNDIF